MDDTKSKLLTEAFVVGAGLMPVYFITHSFLSVLLPRMSDNVVDYTSIFISGALFHLLAEETGINDWYLDNGVAVLKRQVMAVEETGMGNDYSLCDGQCGWKELGGLCSHHSLHFSPLY